MDVKTCKFPKHCTLHDNVNILNITLTNLLFIKSKINFCYLNILFGSDVINSRNADELALRKFICMERCITQ